MAQNAAFEVEDVESNKEQETNIEEEEENKEEDPWALTTPEVKTVPWNELTAGGKAKRVLWDYIFIPILLLFLVYMFICSLDFLSSAFRLLGGKTASEVFSNSEIFSNPIAGLMIGVLVTVLVQSSSTSTSIVVSMVGSGLLKVQTAIYIIMGANIGTTVTNTVVSLGQSGDRKQFRRAFAGATVINMFNWLSVGILLPIEWATGYLNILSYKIVESFQLNTSKDSNVKFLKAITEPFTHYIVKVDTDIISKIALNQTDPDTSLVKTNCGKGNSTEKCVFAFMNVAGVWDDWVIGLILFFIALFILCACLILIVKILNSIFSGRVAVLLKKFVNSDFPGCGKYFTGYAAMLVGAILTILFNSSSVFTSALTPLVGVGVVSIDRMYTLCLGANIGTTFTAILASLAQEGDALGDAMQVSMCHLFFNLTGILLWYPIPFLRKLPVFLAKRLGNITAKYRWFAIVYLIVMFFALPAGIFGLSVLGPWVLGGVLIPIAVFVIIIAIINVLQRRRPKALPMVMRNWDFLPLCCHSFKPIDRLFIKACGRCPCCKNNNKPEDEDEDEDKDEEQKLSNESSTTTEL